MENMENQILIVVLDKDLSFTQVCARIQQIKALHGVEVVRSLETLKEAVKSVLEPGSDLG